MTEKSRKEKTVIVTGASAKIQTQYQQLPNPSKICFQ
jgi:hypothetical protein